MLETLPSRQVGDIGSHLQMPSLGSSTRIMPKQFPKQFPTEQMSSPTKMADLGIQLPSSTNSTPTKRSKVLVVGRGGYWHSDTEIGVMNTSGKIRKKKSKRKVKPTLDAYMLEMLGKLII
jgi:hypothetical protein